MLFSKFGSWSSSENWVQRSSYQNSAPKIFFSKFGSREILLKIRLHRYFSKLGSKDELLKIRLHKSSFQNSAPEEFSQNLVPQKFFSKSAPQKFLTKFGCTEVLKTCPPLSSSKGLMCRA
jgi:hypothetical protein